MSALPSACACTCPIVLTDATRGSELVHRNDTCTATRLVSKAVAVNVPSCPTWRVSVSGWISTFEIGGMIRGLVEVEQPVASTTRTGASAASPHLKAN